MRNSFVRFSLLGALVCGSAIAQPYHSLQPISGFGNSGALLADGTVPFLTTGAVQRGLARNPVTGNLILVDRGVGGQTADVVGGIYVLDGLTGGVIRTLSTNGMAGGSFAHYSVGFGDDGVVYVGNVIVDTNAGPYKVYRWDSESSTSDPVVAFSGSLSTNNLRWGNTIDVRGSGATSQILVSSGGAEASILTTTDGTNFVANNLLMDVTGSLQGSLDFGVGDTFWAKWAGLDLRLLSFNIATKTAATTRIYGGTDMPEMTAPEIAAVDNVEKLLTVVHYHGANPDEVLLYNIANPNDLPQLLDSYTISAINNGNSGSPKGYLAIGGGKVYAHNLNNGVFAFNLVSGSLPAPTIVGEPSPVSVLAGSSAKFRVVAQRGYTFQWRKGVASIPGATNSTLMLTNVQLTDTANYSVIVSNTTGSVTSTNALLTVLSPSDTYHLTQIWSTAPNAQPYFTTTGGVAGTPNQRSLAYNAFSNHLYVVSRASSTSPAFNISVVNADTGALLYTLNTNGVNFSGFAGQIGLVGIDVAEDGAIYACNVDIASPNVWRLYRWANGDPATQPVQVFAGDPLNSGSSFRWGDNLAVRGSGINTEIIIDTQGAGPNGFIAVLKPSDAFMTNFASSFWFQENTTGTTAGRSLQFSTGNTYWQRRRSTPLIRSSYSPDNPIAPVVSSYTNFPTSIGLMAVDETKELVAAVNLSGATGVSPDTVDLYLISDIDHPALLSRVNFPVNKVNNTPNMGKIIIAGNRVYALESQNGLLAFKLEIGISVSPTLSITRNGGNVSLSWQGNGFTLEGTSTLTPPVWQSIPYDPGATNTATDGITNLARFYRLRK